MDQDDLKALLFYYFREKYYNSALSAAKEGIAKYKGEPCFHLFHALALILTHHIEEGIHILDSIMSENEIKLSVIIAVMYANKLLGIANRELFLKLDSEMKDIRKIAEPIDFYYSGFVLFSLHKLEKALDYLDKALTMESGLLECWSLKGWVLLELKKTGRKSVASISEIFLQALQIKKNLDAFFGLGEAYLYENNYEEAQSVANKIVVRFPNLDLPLILKLKVQLAVQNWDHISETLNRILLLNPNSLDALKVTILIMLCRDANYEEAVLCIKKFMSVFDKIEPKNGILLLETSRLFSQVCERNRNVVNETYNMIELAARNFPDNSEFVCELGFQCLMQNKLKEAIRFFKSALKIDSSSSKALMGSIMIELEQNGVSEQAKDQIDHLFDIKGAQNSPITMFLRAKVSETEDEAINYLNKASDYHLNPIKHYPYSDNFLKMLNPDFLLQVIREYLRYISFVSDLTFKMRAKKPSPAAVAVENILTILHKACPGMLEPLFLLAKIQYHIIGDINNATSNVELLLNRQNISSEAYLLMAQIQIRNGTYERAAQSLEEGLSIDFKLRENLIYHFINGVVQKKLNNLQDSIKSLTTAITMMNGKHVSDEYTKNTNLNEKAAIFIELIDAHNQIGQIDEAMKLLDEATEELQKTPEESRIVLLCAEQAVNHNNIQGALDLLEKVHPSDAYYSQARTRYADILLEYRKDKHSYLDCYLKMVDENPCVEIYMLLGNAYMTILEPDLAIETYTKALKENMRDPYVNLKLGETLEYAHYFNRAIDFYKEAIELTNNMELKLQLAQLYMQMKEYIKAEHLLVSEIEAETSYNVDDLTFLQYKTRILNLLATIQEKAGNMAGALITLKDAKDNQNRVRKRLAIELPRVPQNEIDCLIKIYIKLAEMSIYNKENDKAINYYKEACDVAPENVSILGALAKLYMQMNSLELCQQTCASILNIDNENEEASVIMADIAFHKVDFDMALFHFTQLFTKQPTNWNALVRLIEIMRRTGNLEEIPDYLGAAEKMCDNPLKDGGFLYSKALYQWYSGNPNGALRNFNMTRQDPEWGLKAIYNMIEICLNPEDDMLTDQFVDSDDLEYRDSRSMALKTADRLLKELKLKLSENGELLKFKLLTNFRLLATKEKPLIEQGLEGFIALASQNAYKDHVGVTLGISTAYTLLKQSQRAKNQLKRVVKHLWTFEEAEYLEKCWLLLSDYYVQSGKYDVASDLLAKVIQYNKTSRKAYEYLGFICEKEQKYKDGAANYELAFKYSGKSNASIGYKLAYAFMKSKNYPDAIDVAQQVVKINPDYSLRIKKDILDKSTSNLRV